MLLEHDQAIVAVTARLNEPRIVRGERPIAWKYFQYLALLFTEIYLDRWFRDPRALLAALNAHVAAFNEGKAEPDRVSPFGEATTETEASAQLDKLAFWMATGSGKTLLMHAHVLQYRRLLMRHGRDRDLNRILLLTPNEGLSRQHLRELETAGIEAEIFDKQGRGTGGRGLFAGRAVEILEITRLRDEMGDRTVAVEAFEGNNLVLIDEGHRGDAAGEDGAWMRFRNALCEKGFSFEYSATFGQAVKGNPALGDLYARSTLFDYSHRWFHGDGFGKDYRILNLDEDGGMSLKRSARAELPRDLERPEYIEPLETLHIFGIRANYMAQFRDFLEEEGLSPDDGRIEFHLPIIRNLGRQPLKTIRLRKTIHGVGTASGDAFRRLGPVPTLRAPDELAADDPGERGADHLRRNPVVLNWYPKIQAMGPASSSSSSAAAAPTTDDDDDTGAAPEQAHLQPEHVAFLDLDHLFFELERFKAERGWHNLNLSRAGIRDLLTDTTWYRVLIPESGLRLDSFGKVRLWQEIALALLKKYTERYYTFRKHQWELPHLEYRALAEDDPNLPTVREERGEYGYRILVEKSRQDVVARLEELKAAIESGALQPWTFQGLSAVWFDRHLYQPLLALEGGVVEISPAPLNRGERRFVEDLKTYCDGNPAAFEGRELYLLRNRSRGRGIGFFEAGNFHPDFILWLLAGDRQHVTFVDPKGIRNVGVDDPKIRFFETIKEIERRLGDPKVALDSFIVSRTPSHVMRKLWGIGKPDMAARHIAFQEEDRASYIGAMLRGIGGGRAAGSRR